MTNIERAEYARGLKAAGKCNCAQAVVAALYDLTNLDLDTLLQTTSGFAVGMGNMEATCGALIGANIQRYYKINLKKRQRLLYVRL